MRSILEHKSKELPVNLEEIREHFALFETDEEIAKLLQNAVEHIELQTGLSLQKKTWKIIHDNSYISLPYGPVSNVISVHDSNGNKIEPVSVKRASGNVILNFKDDQGMVKIRYETGYDRETLPECLKQSIFEKFWEVYADNLLSDSSWSNKVDDGMEYQIYNKMLQANS